jgi:hypothetical protein
MKTLEVLACRIIFVILSILGASFLVLLIFILLVWGTYA